MTPDERESLAREVYEKAIFRRGKGGIPTWDELDDTTKREYSRLVGSAYTMGVVSVRQGGRVSASESAAIHGIAIKEDPEAQDRIDVLTGKRVSFE